MSDPSVIPSEVEGSHYSKSEINKTFTGFVTQFDSHIGLGQIVLEDGRELPFHCVHIADGSREIDEHQKVSFELFFHPRNRFEAKNIIKIDETA